jgi:hypothetical protein
MPYKKRLHARFPPVSNSQLLSFLLEFVLEFCLNLKARIKKIMQMDEEVGKVSSQVPVMVCILFKTQTKIIKIS